MKTIDETIEYLEETARNQLECAEKIDELGCDSTSIRSMSDYHRQLAGWLKELKGLREDEDVKDVFNNCETCKYLKLDSDDYPCDRCMHRYINQYVYDDKREVNADG